MNDETEPAKVDVTDEADATTEAGDEVTDGEVTDDAADDVSADDSDYDEALLADPPPRTLFRRLLVPVALAVLLLASIGLTTWFYLAQFRPDQQTNDAAKATVMQAAAAGTTSLLSYSPDTLDKDFANAKTHLTGDFLNYYTQFTHDIVTPAARDKAVKTSATVVQSGVSEMNPTSATVLLYLNQTTTSKENPDGSFTASSVKVGLTKVGNDWLINAFDPV
jgi:Mce-associated membrane protein